MEPLSTIAMTTAANAGEGLSAVSVETVKTAGVTDAVASVDKGCELAGALQAIPQISVVPNGEIGSTAEIMSNTRGIGFDFNREGYEFSPDQLGVGFSQTLEGLTVTDFQRIGEMRELYAENWNSLSIEGRQEALQSLENMLAKTQGREACTIVVEDMPSVLNCGSYRHSDMTIRVNKIHLEDVDYRREAIDTIAHEGRHAYQHWAVEHPGFHPVEKEVAYWAENFNHYMNSRKFGFEYYESQPVEVDARRYASIVKTALDFGENISIEANDKVLAEVSFGSSGEGIDSWLGLMEKTRSRTFKEYISDAAESIRDFFLEHTTPAMRRSMMIAIAHGVGRKFKI